MNSYRCGKCGQKIYERAGRCPFCSARLVYVRRAEGGAAMTAAFGFLLLLYLVFVFGFFYDRGVQVLGKLGGWDLLLGGS